MINDQEFSFNENQKKAVEYTKGPLLIIAGAGTGKTHAIVGKITHLIKNNLATSQQILGLTFTEKGAFEMEERVDRAIPYGYFQMWISTFHAFADRILKEEASQIGLNSGYKLMTESESVIFMRKNLFLFRFKYFRPLGNPNKFIEAILQHFSRLKDEDISPDDYKRWVKSLKNKKDIPIEEKEKYGELSAAYEKYQDLKIKEKVCDFSDLVYYLLELFRKRPNVLKKYQDQFKYILVDEFQDTNIAQYQLIKLLSPAKSNPKLTVVGDDAQAIYKFRGASVSNILSFMKDYPKAEQVTLNINYRSRQEILDTAYKLIKNNDPDTLEAQLGISKNLKSSRKNKKDSVEFYLGQNVEDEAEYVGNKIIDLKKNYNYSDFAILVRANNHANPFIKSFTRMGIPYQFLGPGMLYKQPEVKDLIAYLKILYDLGDSVSFYRVLTMDIFNLDKKDISLLLSFTKRVNLSFFQAIEIYLSFTNQDLWRSEFEIYRKFTPLLKEESKKTLQTIYDLIVKHLSRLKKETAGQILFNFLEETKYLNRLVAYKTDKEEKIALNVSKFFNKLKTYEAEHEDASVFAVIEYLDMSMELGESPIASKTDISTYEAVNILTVHASKGLEFPVVFMPNLTAGRFPTTHKKEPIAIPTELIKETLPQGDYHIEEERRLFYVGLTRAMDHVFLSASKFYEEGKRERKVSPFVFESVGEENILRLINRKQIEKMQLSIFDFKKPQEIITKEKLMLSNFSFSQIETFETCPLQYKYRYVLKIPTTPSSAASFGDTIHRTLQLFYQEYITHPKVDKKRLLGLLETNWNPAGYSSSDHEVRMKKEGREMLERFYDTFHNSQIKIVGLERLFKIKIDEDIFVTGKIDRVDQKKDGSIEIIDYKTGKKPKESDIQKSLQLSIYALAATDKGLYQKKLDQVNLTFYYLQDAQKISVQREPKDLLVLKEKIKDSAQKIRGDDFSPNVGPWCDFCSFRMICEAWQ